MMGPDDQAGDGAGSGEQLGAGFLVFGVGACLASRRVMEAGERVGYLYREKPSNGIDSGWRFFAGSGKGTAEEMAAYDVSAVVRREPALAECLAADVGSAFRREGDKFVRVESQ